MKSVCVVVLLACLSQAFESPKEVIEIGKDEGDVAFEKGQHVPRGQTHSELKVHLRPTERVTYIRVTVQNLFNPKFDYEFKTNTLYLKFKSTSNNKSFYKVLVKTLPGRRPYHNSYSY